VNVAYDNVQLVIRRCVICFCWASKLKINTNARFYMKIKLQPEPGILE